MRKPPARPFWRRIAQLLTWPDLLKIARMVGYEPHAGQVTIHENRSRWRAISNGRRFGKTTLCAFEAVAVASIGGWVMCVAPTYDLSSKVFNEALRMVMSGQMASTVLGYRTAKGDQVIQFASGGRIVAKSSDNPKSLVGDGWDLIVFDECAKEADPEVWHRQLRPALIERQGAALFPSTPEGDNWFKELWDKGQTGVKAYASWQMPTGANPLNTPEELESLTEGMTEADYQQEILAIFLDSVGGVFRGYREVATALWQDGPIEGHRYVLGVDIAQHKDWTVIAVFDMTIKAFVHLIRFNQISYPIQEEQIAEASRRWSAPVMIDATNNESVAQHLDEKIWWAPVEPFKFTNLSKTEVVNQLGVAIEKKEIQLLAADQRTIEGGKNEKASILAKIALSEMGSFKYERTPSGLLRMNAPEGKHDDVVSAKVLAYEMARMSIGGTPYVAPAPSDRSEAPPLSGTFTPKVEPKMKGRPFRRGR